MADNKSDWLEAAVLNYFLRDVLVTRPTSRFLALYTVQPNSETGAGGTEVTGGSYARQAVTFSAPTATSTVSLDTTCTFPTPTASWGTVVGWAVFDNNANMLYSAPFTQSKAVAIGATVSIVNGESGLTIQEN